jgi:hypothetical protein
MAVTWLNLEHVLERDKRPMGRRSACVACAGRNMFHFPP